MKFEKDARLQDTKNIFSFGIEFLDKALIGILPSDLIILGAKSGIGKTEISLHIAGHNAQRGKRVAFFALEAEQHEIARRLKYKELAKAYFEKPAYRRREISYRKFRFAKLEETFAPYEKQVTEKLEKQFENLYCYYRKSSFDVTLLKQIVSSSKDNIDMMIIDHLHYFDLYGESKNDLMAELVKEIRKINLIYNIPVILVAHLRKGGSAVPDLEDFMGTSDIGKIGTAAIMISPDLEKQNYRDHKHGTFFRVVKSRLGSLSRVIGSVEYCSARNEYDNSFDLYSIDKKGEFNEMVKQDYPLWAKEDVDDYEDIPF